jgi:2'-5' RNA ligase
MKKPFGYLSEGMHQGGTYSSLIPSTEVREQLIAFLTDLGIDNVTPVRDMHCTLIYSRTDCSDIGSEDFTLPCSGIARGYQVFGEDEKVLVLELYCPNATRLHELFKEKYGATHDYDSYIPHITVASNFQGKIPAELPDFDIEFTGFVVEELT